MEITNLSSIQSSSNIQGLHRTPAEKDNMESARQTASLKDSVSFSDEALRLSGTAKTNTESAKIRFDLVNRIKAEINAGTYDTPEKMDTAMERMVSRIFS